MPTLSESYFIKYNMIYCIFYVGLRHVIHKCQPSTVSMVLNSSNDIFSKKSSFT